VKWSSTAQASVELCIERIFFNVSNDSKLTFTQLLPPSGTKEDKIYTFIPLLHLTTQRKVDLSQKEHFGEIEIMLAAKREVDKELDKSIL